MCALKLRRRRWVWTQRVPDFSSSSSLIRFVSSRFASPSTLFPLFFFQLCTLSLRPNEREESGDMEWLPCCFHYVATMSMELVSMVNSKAPQACEKDGETWTVWWFSCHWRSGQTGKLTSSPANPFPTPAANLVMTIAGFRKICYVFSLILLLIPIADNHKKNHFVCRSSVLTFPSNWKISACP